MICYIVDSKVNKTRYEADRAEAYKDYEVAAAVVEGRYKELMDEADDNDDWERDIKRWRKEQMLLLQRALDREYAKIDRKFAPDVQANAKKLQTVKREITVLKNDVKALLRPETLLKQDCRKIENTEPFEIDAYWRTVALWLARVPLERPDLPGPAPAASESTPSPTGAATPAEAAPNEADAASDA